MPLLQDLKEDQLTKMAEAVQPVSFKAGEDIIVKGENGSIFYIIKTGTVVCKDIGGGNMNDLRLGPGDYFGELALLKDQCKSIHWNRMGGTWGKISFPFLLWRYRTILAF